MTKPGTHARSPWYAALSEPHLPVSATIRIDLAAPEEYDAIAGLLDEVGLSTMGLFEAAELILVARDGFRIVGCAAVERYGVDGLLRSVATSEPVRGTGLGQRLVDQAEKACHESGLSTLYLLTETAESFFAKRGYVVVDRTNVPVAVRASTQFATLCPASATAMARAIGTVESVDSRS